MWIEDCDSNACIIPAPGSTAVWIGDSTQRGADRWPVLSVPRHEFAAFVAAIKAGKFRR